MVAVIHARMPNVPGIACASRPASPFPTHLCRGDDYIMGIMGPLLRAEVGDTIRVTFKNNLKDHAGELARQREGAEGAAAPSSV